MPLRIAQHVVPRRHRSTFVWRARYSRPSFAQRGSVQPGTFSLVLGVSVMIVLALLGFFYLQQVLQTASQGTDVQELESRLVELRDRQRQLELEGAQLRSLQTVEQRVQKLNLIKTDQVTYLAGASGRVAAAEN